jgi:hypothetical protein
MATPDSAPDTDSANDAWLSQTVGAPCPDQAGTLGPSDEQIVGIVTTTPQSGRQPMELQ